MALNLDYKINTKIPENTDTETESNIVPVKYEKNKGISEFGMRGQSGTRTWADTLNNYKGRVGKPGRTGIDLEDLINQYNGADGYTKVDETNKDSMYNWLTKDLGVSPERLGAEREAEEQNSQSVSPISAGIGNLAIRPATNATGSADNGTVTLNAENERADELRRQQQEELARQAEEKKQRGLQAIQDELKANRNTANVAAIANTASAYGISPQELANLIGENVTEEEYTNIAENYGLPLPEHGYANQEFVDRYNTEKEAENVRKSKEDKENEYFGGNTAWTKKNEQRARALLAKKERDGFLADKEEAKLAELLSGAKAAYNYGYNEQLKSKSGETLTLQQFDDKIKQLERELTGANDLIEKATIQQKIDALKQEKRDMLADTSAIYEQWAKNKTKSQKSALDSVIDSIHEYLPEALPFFLSHPENWTNGNGEPDKKKIFQNITMIADSLRYGLHSLGNAAFKVAGKGSENVEPSMYNKIKNSQLSGALDRYNSGKSKTQDANLQLLINQYGISQEIINKVREQNAGLEEKIRSMGLDTNQQAFVYKGMEKLGDYLDGLTLEDRSRVLEAMLMAADDKDEAIADVLKVLAPNVIQMINTGVQAILTTEANSGNSESREDAVNRIEQIYGNSTNMPPLVAVVEGFKEMKRWFGKKEK